MYKNVLWIDPAVRDYQVFVDSVNEDTLALVYPVPLVFGVERIGFVFEKHGPMAAYLQSNANLLIGSGVKHMDFLACDTLPEWEPYYNTLTGITVGASNNQTGNLQYGGDWLMESTCEDVESIYFTRSIQYYQYLLGFGDHSMVIDSSGKIWSWGGDVDRGQLGRVWTGNTTTGSVTTLSNVIAISTGRSHSIALDSSRNVWTCGQPGDQLGRDGLTTNFNLVNISNIIAISGGSLHSMALDSSRNVWTCGSNQYGELGQPLIVTNTSRFSRVTELSNIIAIYAGGYHSMALDSSRNVWTCGSNQYGQLGQPLIVTNTSRFSRVTELSNIIAISAGEYHSMVLDSSRNVWTCGSNSNRQLGRVWTEKATNFSRVNISNIIAISAGGYHSMALDSSRNVWTCGDYQYGQLGRVWTRNDTNFSRVPTLSNIISIEAYSRTSAALDSSKRVLTCGQYPGRVGSNNDFVVILTNIVALSNLDYLTITLSRFEPSSAPSKTFITLYGENFSNITSVNFGGTPVQLGTNASFTWNSSTNLSVKVPDAIPVSTPIFIKDAAGTIYTYFDYFTNTTVTATTFTPTSAISKSTIALNCTNFSNLSAVLFGSANASFTVNSLNLSVIVPDSIPPNCSIGIWDIYGNNARYPVNFTNTTITATTFNPTSAFSNSILFLNGTNFSNISAVLFGSLNASFTVNSSILLSARLPDVSNCSIGVWDIYGNNVSYPGTLTLATLTTFTPMNMMKKGVIFLSGTNLSNLSAVQFGNVNATFVLNSSVNLSVVVPAGPNCSIRVHDKFGNSALYSDTFTAINLSYAFQVSDKLTLVGSGLAGLAPGPGAGLPSFFASDTAPMFTGSLANVSLSKNGFYTDNLLVYPVTVLKSNSALNPDVIRVRGMPTGKIPDSVGVFYL